MRDMHVFFFLVTLFPLQVFRLKFDEMKREKKRKNEKKKRKMNNLREKR